jgi:hypothetical protein
VLLLLLLLHVQTGSLLDGGVRRSEAVLPQRHAALVTNVWTDQAVICSAAAPFADFQNTQARFWTEVYDGAKLFYLSGMQHGKYLKREVSLTSRNLWYTFSVKGDRDGQGGECVRNLTILPEQSQRTTPP